MMESKLLARVYEISGEPVLGPGQARVAEVIERLERGESPAAVSAALGLSPQDLLAALALDALGPSGSLGPALVQTKPRRPKLRAALDEPALATLLPDATRPARLSLAAGLLQVHDFWDASHEAAQEADDLGETGVASYWHGIAHRREPDAGNAAYWFRRVGRHRIFEPLAQAARPVVQEHARDTALANLTACQSPWDPFAMIELCTRARAGSAQAEAAQMLQRLEMALLLDRTAELAGITLAQ